MRCYVGVIFLLAVAALLIGASHAKSAARRVGPLVGGSWGEAAATAAVSAVLLHSNGNEEDRRKAPQVADADGDGVQDEVDNCIMVSNPGQEDGDGDEVGDACDSCPDTGRGDPVDSDGCSTSDDDSDGVLNDQDACPNTAAGDPVDASGCATGDDDGDGVLNDEDDCPDTSGCAEAGPDGCPLDGDDDGVPDGCDLCPDTPADGPVDADGCSAATQQGCCGATGPVAPLGLAVGMLVLARLSGRRRHGQGLPSGSSLPTKGKIRPFYDGPALLLAAATLLAGAGHARAIARPISYPTDGGPGEQLAQVDALNSVNSGSGHTDGEITPAAADSDFDGVIDYDDNCPSNPNPGQEDGDGDGVGDACDDCPNTASGDPVNGLGCSTADDDGDGVLNDQDDCPQTAPGDPIDGSGCSTADDDADGVLNDEDDCADTPTCAEVGSDGCPLDGDSDGAPDGCDNCPEVANADQADADADGIGDACDQTSCCGAAGPVVPLGLMIGMALLSRHANCRDKTRYPAEGCGE